MSIQILKLPYRRLPISIPTSIIYLQYLQQCNLRWEHENQMPQMQSFLPFFPRLVQTMPLINDLKAADIKGAIFGRYMQLPSLKQQPGYTFKGLLNDDVWRCVMMCDDSQKQELTSTASLTVLEASWQRAKILCAVSWGRLFDYYIIIWVSL